MDAVVLHCGDGVDFPFDHAPYTLQHNSVLRHSIYDTEFEWTSSTRLRRHQTPTSPKRDASSAGYSRI